MRSRYPLVSQELNDIFLGVYERQVVMLGNVNDQGVVTYSGLYDILQDQTDDATRNYVLLNNTTSPDNGISVPNKLDLVTYKKNLIRSK